MKIMTKMKMDMTSAGSVTRPTMPINFGIIMIFMADHRYFQSMPRAADKDLSPSLAWEVFTAFRCACQLFRKTRLEKKMRWAAIRGRKTSGSFTIRSKNGSDKTAPPNPSPVRTKPLQAKIRPIAAY